MSDLARARAPLAALRAALYESHYLTAVDPAGGRAVWIRYTSLKRPGEPARPTVWVTWFERGAGAPRAFRVTAPEPLTAAPPAWARSALGEIAAGYARGALEGASWELSWAARVPELPYLPARWLYDRPLPRSQGVALAPRAEITGCLDLGGERVRLDAWEGMVGHNWGSEHAEQWSWLHGAADEGWFDLVLVRVRIGPLLTPWIASGAVALDGRPRRPATGRRVTRTVEGERTRVAVPLRGRETFEVDLTAPAVDTVRWDYASPAGRGREVTHCTIADARARVGERSFALAGRAAVEHGAPAGGSGAG
jgi:hypothetical protein